MTKDFIENILAYCQNKGITEAQFEKKCNLSKGMISKWKSGNRMNPSITTLLKIQEGTGISYTRWLKKGAFDAKRA